MNVQSVVEAMAKIAPPELAEKWDKVGLQIGRPGRELTGPVLVTIDLTEDVLQEAVEAGCSMIVAYHPPVWEPMVRVTAASPRERIVLGAIEAGIAIYSPHTALDAAQGGLTDWLCAGISGAGPDGRIAGDCRALRPHPEQPATQQVKIVTFVPEKDADRVRSSLATGGAGIIGKYQVCSFAAPGTGTFLAGEGARPAVGEAGTLQRVPEVRLEMVCARAALPIALETLRNFHPYEEPAIDVVALEPTPRRAAGAGRRLALDKPATVGELARRLKGFLGCNVVKMSTPWPDRPISRVAVCAGAGADLVAAAVADACEVFVTGELKHHEVVGALNRELAVILGGHTNTERGYMPHLARRLEPLLPGVKVLVSQRDRDPLTVV
jgi:dinuclear metal center YbgI/SA1388 family protein